MRLNITDFSRDLFYKKQNAFILLTTIAIRARRDYNKFMGLEAKECYIEDHKSYGLTAAQYRLAKQNLVDYGLISIKVDGNKTIAKLLNDDVYYIEMNVPF